MGEDLRSYVTRLREIASTPGWLLDLAIGAASTPQIENPKLFNAFLADSTPHGILLYLCSRGNYEPALHQLSTGTSWVFIGRGEPTWIQYFLKDQHRLQGLNVTLFTKHPFVKHPNGYNRKVYATLDPTGSVRSSE